MPTLTLPAGLPPPLAGGHKVERVDLCESVQLDSGRTRRRPLYFGQPKRVTLAWRLRQEQFDAFHAWWLGAAKQGGVVFQVPHITSAGAVGYTPGIATDPPAYELDGESLTWRVSLSALVGGVAATLAALDETYVPPTPAARLATMAITVPESPTASFTLQAPVKVTLQATDPADASQIQLWSPLTLGSLGTVEGTTDAAALSAKLVAKVTLGVTEPVDVTNIYIGYVTFSCLNHVQGAAYAAPSGSATDLTFSDLAYTAPQSSGCSI